MELTWMGKHRAAVEAVIRTGNSYARSVDLPGLMSEQADLSPVELQVMEYILENEERRENMSQVAARLDISQSHFSKLVARLVSKGLLERFRTANNRKNVIVQPTELARQVYLDYAEAAAQSWQPFFEELDRMGPEFEAGFIRATGLFADLCDTARERFCQRERDTIELIPLD